MLYLYDITFVTKGVPQTYHLSKCRNVEALHTQQPTHATRAGCFSSFELCTLASCINSSFLLLLLLFKPLMMIVALTIETFGFNMILFGEIKNDIKNTNLPKHFFSQDNNMMSMYTTIIIVLMLHTCKCHSSVYLFSTNYITIYIYIYIYQDNIVHGIYLEDQDQLR